MLMSISMLDLVYTIIIPALFAVVCIFVAIVYALMPSSAKLLTKKKFGLLKTKAFDLIAWDDRVLTLEALDVTPEGLLEKDAKKGRSKNFYLAKALDNTANPDNDLLVSERELDILPPYVLDGIPINFSHISKAIATNPRVLTALHVAHRIEQLRRESKSQSEFEAKVLLPETVKFFDEASKAVETNVVEVNVKLPYDPVDIKKSFPAYWQQSNIDSTKRRNQNIGMEKQKQSLMGMVKWIALICIVAVAVSVAAMLIVYFTTQGQSPEPVVPPVVAALRFLLFKSL